MATSCFLIKIRWESLRSWLGLLKDTLKHFHTLDSSWDFEQPQIGSGQESERRELRWLPAPGGSRPRAGPLFCAAPGARGPQPPALRVGAAAAHHGDAAASLTVSVVDPSQNQTGVSSAASAFMRVFSSTSDVTLTCLCVVALFLSFSAPHKSWSWSPTWGAVRISRSADLVKRMCP